MSNRSGKGGFFCRRAEFFFLGIAIRAHGQSFLQFEMPLEFNLDEEFPYLSKAPIVEAVLQINARAAGDWAQERVFSALTSEFGGRIALQPIQTSQAVFTGSPVGGLEKTSFESSWLGFRIATPSPPEVVSFTRDSFSFSRLRPYERWNRFLERAMALFQLHIRTAKPGAAQRIGLRFINRIEMSNGLRLDGGAGVAVIGADGVAVTGASRIKLGHRTDCLPVPRIQNWRGIPKPRRCPFCKQAKGEIRRARGGFQGVCSNCGATGPKRESYDDALRVWNGKG